MSLSLEVKKFVNSEHIGSFVTVTLPSELPVENEEIRAVRRDTAAAERAEHEAIDREDEMHRAEQALENAEQELQLAREQMLKIESECKLRQEKCDTLAPKFDDAKKELDAARREYEQKKAESDRLEAAYSEAEAKRSADESAHTMLLQRIADGRAALERAKDDAVSAANDEAEFSDRLAVLKEENVELEVTSARAGEVSEELQQQLREREAAYNELHKLNVDLDVEKRVLEKQLNEAQQLASKALSGYQKAQTDLSNAEQQYANFQSTAQKRSSDKDAVKLSALRSKIDAAAAEVQVRLSNHEKEAEQVELTKRRLAECEHRLIESTEKLKTVENLFLEAKKRYDDASQTHLTEGARLSGKRADMDSVTTRLDDARSRIAGARKASADATELIAVSEAALTGAKKTLDGARDEASARKRSFDQAKASSDLASKQLNQKKAEYDDMNSRVDAASGELETAKAEQRAQAERISSLEKRLEAAKIRLSGAQEDSAAASEEARRLRESIHVIKTRYEQAKMHYLESGKGEPLLLIHTAGQSLYTFRSLFYKLAMSYRVIALDLVGHGYSDRPDFFDYTISDHADSIAGFMDAMGIESAHLLGFSMGAGYALEFARKYPARTERVIAIAPGGITGAMPLSIRMIESGFFGPLASRLYRLKTVEKLLDDCVFDHTAIGPHDIAEYFRPASDPAGRDAIRRTVAAFDEYSLTASLHEIAAPVLIIWGDDDKWHPVEASNYYRSSIPDASLTIVRNAGHIVHEEKPDRVYELVRSFIPAGFGNDD